MPQNDGLREVTPEPGLMYATHSVPPMWISPHAASDFVWAGVSKHMPFTGILE